MKSFKIVLMAIALFVAGATLSHFAAVARSSEKLASSPPTFVVKGTQTALRAGTRQSHDYWKSKIGQRCSVLYSNRDGNNGSVTGILKGATDSWVVVSDVLETASVNGKPVGKVKDYCFPTDNVAYVSFERR